MAPSIGVSLAGIPHFGDTVRVREGTALNPGLACGANDTMEPRYTDPASALQLLPYPLPPFSTDKMEHPDQLPSPVIP